MEHFMNKEIKNFSVLEYVWLDSKNGIRSKCRTLGEQYMLGNIKKALFVDLNRKNRHRIIAKQLEWTVNGHDMYPNSLAPPGDYSDIILRPVYIIQNKYLNNKFKSDNYYLCMCQTFDHLMRPLANNNYNHNLELMKDDIDNLPCFSFEQSSLQIELLNKTFYYMPHIRF